MHSFLKNSLEIETDYDLSEAKSVLNESVCKSTIYKMKCSKKPTDDFIIVPINNSVLFRNSFAPVAKVRFNGDNGKTRVVADIEVRKSVKVILWIYNTLACGTELVLLYFFATQNLMSPFLLLLPLGLMAFSLFMTYVGFALSKNSLRDLICSAYGDGSTRGQGGGSPVP